MLSEPVVRASRVGGSVVLVSGLAAAAANCAFLFRSASGSRLDPVNSMISELEVPGQPDSEFFRWASLVSGVLVVVFAAGLHRRIPPGWAASLGCAALAGFGLAGAVDALIPMDCAPSASFACLRAEEDGPRSWPYQAHTWFDVAGTVALLLSLWLLGRHLHRHPGWRHVGITGRAAFAGLAAGSLLLTAMSIVYAPGVGLVQRIQVLAISLWLVVLALAQSRLSRE